MRKRRSMLFVPGDDLKKLTKAAQSAADCVILEMEDGVALNRKAEARETIVQALKTVDFGPRERVVRVNGIHTPFFTEDVLRAVPARPDAIIVPKVESAGDMHTICATLRTVESAHGFLPLPLMVMIESPLGILNLKEIAQADSRLCALIFGADDLSSALGAQRTRAGDEVFYARSAVVLTAAAFGLSAIDMIFADFTTTPVWRRNARWVMRLGYAGKTLIHPRQIEMANRCFSPTPDEIAHARRVIDGFRAHQAGGAGAFALDGKMIDMPIVHQAERVLAMAE